MKIYYGGILVTNINEYDIELVDGEYVVPTEWSSEWSTELVNLMKNSNLNSKKCHLDYTKYSEVESIEYCEKTNLYKYVVKNEIFYDEGGESEDKNLFDIENLNEFIDFLEKSNVSFESNQ